MRSLVAAASRAVSNRAPVPYVSRTARVGPGLGPGLFGNSTNSLTAQLEAMSRNGTLFQITSRTAEAVAAADWHLYRKRRPGQEPDAPREEVLSHAVLDLWAKPNPFWTGLEFREGFQQHVELTGLGYWVVYRVGRISVPLELWHVRPDRIRPVPSPRDYLTGWVYIGPDGEEVPLRLDEVIQIRRPNPTDPYGGLGPVEPIMTDLDAARLAAEWNRNFFYNSAEPGGIIEVDRRLDDDEFDELVERWQSQHRGVARAHRVAVLEHGKWVDRKLSQRDMQFEALRNLPRELVREATGFPKPMLGSVDDINRANADAGAILMARQVETPRLVRVRDVLNYRLLPLYGRTAEGLEWDFDPPEEDAPEDERAWLTTRVDAAVKIIGVGFDKIDTLKKLELPDIALAEPEPAPAPARPALPSGREDQDDEDDVDADRDEALAALRRAVPVRVEVVSVDDLLASLRGDEPAGARPRVVPGEVVDKDPDEPAGDEVILPDLAAVQAAWETALAQLLDRLGPITAAQRVELVDAVRAAVAAGDVAALRQLAASWEDAAAAIREAMTTLAATAAGQVVDEAAAQGLGISAGVADAERLGAIADATAAALALGLALSAQREALRVWGPDADPDEVADAVRDHLDALTDAQPRQYAGHALTDAQHEGRLATFREAERDAGPIPAYYASEQLDSNTCGPCREVHRKWLGNELGQVLKLYPTGGYKSCQGRERCRGMVVSVWRPEQVGSAG